LQWIDRLSRGLERDMADIVHARHERVELIDVLDGLVLAAIKRGVSRGLRARGGKRDRRPLEACGLVFPAAGGPARCGTARACQGGRSGVSFARARGRAIERV